MTHELEQQDEIIDGVDVDVVESTTSEVQFDDSNAADDDINVVEDDVTSTDDSSNSSEEVVESQDEDTSDSTFAPELLAAAGYTEAEAKTLFSSPQALANAISLADRRLIQDGARLVDASKTTKDTLTETVDSSEEFQLPEPTEATEWSEDTKKLVAALNKRYETELSRRDAMLKQQQEQLKAIAARHEQAERQQYVQEFDTFVTALGDEWKDTFGSGSGLTLAPNSLALQNRVHLDNTARHLAAALESRGQTLPPRAELLVRALRAAFPEKHEAQLERKVTERVAQRNRMLTERPTHRRSQKLTGEEVAAKGVEDFYRSKGISVMEDDFNYTEI